MLIIGLQGEDEEEEADEEQEEDDTLPAKKKGHASLLSSEDLIDVERLP